MKKYIIAALMLAVMCVTACSKLELPPRGEMANKEAAYKSPTIRGQILAGLYSLLYHDGTWGATLSIRMDSGTDVSITRTTGSGTIENNSHTPKDMNTTWEILYKGINAANEFLYYSDLYVADSNIKTQEMNEARFLRAYFYFTLVRLFGDVPMRTEPMLNLNNTDIARTSAVTIYDFIVKELNQAQASLSGPESVVYGHVANTAAQAALADVYLNLSGMLMKDRLPADSTSVLMHQRAAYWCEKVLENPAHDITATRDSVIFMNQVQAVNNVKEQVWEIQTKFMRDAGGYRCDSRLGKYNGMSNTVSGIYGAGGYALQAATLHRLYSKLNDADATNDERLRWNCPTTKIDNGKNADGSFKTQHKKPVYSPVTTDPNNIFQFQVGKWRTIFAESLSESADINYSGTRISMYRIADVHLMYAEALNEGYNNQSGAIDQINIVRRRAKASEISTTPSKDEVFELVVDERARELCFEGKRRFDLIRWGLYESKLTELAKIYRASTNTAWVQDKLGAFDNFNPEAHYIMPIPQAEISRNRLIPQSEQNKGWGGNRAWR